ncbi:hypothetical protein [Rhodococcus maanshanensis]|uniref:Capsular polysaccharide biosynthesis protein n=1 Tax=Rhodococcus maanshanensis TaxID=183556 RepID=A0A1H7MMF2_9NOCA|nr:hypothetical protein [Rhodococcus maanshanensis]SEL12413.1 Capsular polysaccharide biosynthesis protein [Rhodococcus maanshanensis]
MSTTGHQAVLAYARVLRRRWRWVAWGALLALGAGIVGLLVVPPMYRSTATVFIRTPGDVSRVVDGGDRYAQNRAGTYVELAGSTGLAARVIADLGVDASPEEFADRITATAVPGTVLIDVAVDASSADQAQRTATVFLSEFAETVRVLESVDGAVMPRAQLVVVDAPGPPSRARFWGVPTLVVLSAALLIGAVLGAAGAVVRSMFDRAVRDPRDVARLAGAPVLGSIDLRSTGSVTEDARLVRRRLQSLTGDPDRGVIAVTAPHDGSAAAAASRALEAVLRERHESVILVDLDLRSRRLTELLGMEEVPGVSDVLGGHTALVAAVSDHEDGAVLSAGSVVDLPSSFIDSAALPAMIGELRERYAWVLLACPPTLSAADVDVIAAAADAVVIVVRSGVTTDSELLETAAALPPPTVSAALLDRGSDPGTFGLLRSGKGQVQ